MVGLFTLVGDSNVRRHMNSQNCHDRPYMVSAQVKTCGRLEAFSEVIRSAKAETTVFILACLTNFLTSIEGESSSTSLRVEPVLLEFRDLIYEACEGKPDK